VVFNTTRRRFLGCTLSLPAARLTLASEDEAGGLKLGVTTYSLRQFQRTFAIQLIKQLHTRYISVKEFHLPYRSTPEEVARGRKEFEDAGLKIMSGGNIVLSRNDEADMRKYFEYAKACGMPMIVCSPAPDNLKVLGKLVQEYDIRAAILNRVDLDALSGLDPRVGVCIDATRLGAGVVQRISDAGPRVLDVHIKDMRAASDGGGPCDVGEGVVPIVAIFKQLLKIGYSGCVNLEYEVDTDNPLPGLLQSFAYMRGVLAVLANRA
jgi:sugar phosphate isomerase/epimerase